MVCHYECSTHFVESHIQTNIINWATTNHIGNRKVITILEELGLPYEMQALEFANVKNPDYVKINPNGRLPAIQDPNTGVTLWEVSHRSAQQQSLASELDQCADI